MKITSMKIYFLTMLLSLFFLGACDKNDEIVPEDADENFITSVVMTVGCCSCLKLLNWQMYS